MKKAQVFHIRVTGTPSALKMIQKVVEAMVYAMQTLEDITEVKLIK